MHQKEPLAATAKAKDQIRMAVAKVSRDYALERGSVAVVQKALVVGGGVAGLTAALELAERGYETMLLGVECQTGWQRLEPEQNLERRRGPALFIRPDLPSGKSSPGGGDEKRLFEDSQRLGGQLRR